MDNFNLFTGSKDLWHKMLYLILFIMLIVSSSEGMDNSNNSIKEKINHNNLPINEGQLLINNPVEALPFLNNVLDNNKSLVEAWLKKASIEETSTSNDTAILKIYDDAINYNNNSPILWKAKGKYLLKIKNYNESIKSLKNSINLSEKDNESWFLYGKDLYYLGNYSGALYAFDKARNLLNETKFQEKMTLAKILFYYGLAQHELGRYDEAIKSLEVPANNSTCENYADARKWKAFILKKLGRSNSYEVLNVKETLAEFYYKRAFDNFYNDNYTDSNTTKIYNDINESKEFPSQINPDDFSIRFLEGRYLERMNKSNEALKIYNEILNNSAIYKSKNKYLVYDTITPDKFFYNELPYLRRAYILRNLGRLNDSILSFRAALHIDPNNDAARITTGIIQFQQRDYSASLDSFGNCTTYDRDATFYKGYALKNLSKEDEAFKAFDQIIQNNRSDRSAWGELIALIPNDSPKKSIALKIRNSIDYKREDIIHLLLICCIFPLFFLILYFYYRKRFSPIIKIMFINIVNLFTFSCGMYLSAIVTPTIPFIIFILSIIVIILFIEIILDETSSSWRKNADWAFKWFESTLLFSLRRVDGVFLAMIMVAFALVFTFIWSLVNHDLNLAYTSIQSTSTFLIMINITITIIPFINLLKSENLERDTRDLIFFGHLGYLCLLSPYISLILGINGLTILNYNDVYFNTPLGQDTPLLYILIMFMLITITLLFPYVIGETRNKRWTESLLEERMNYLENLLDVLDYPERSDRIKKLAVISEKIDETYKKETFGEFDPREKYKIYLENLNDIVKLLVIKFGELKNNESELAKLADSYSEKMRSRKEEIGRVLDDEKKTKSHFYIYASLFISTIMLAIVNRLIQTISSALFR
jgi:tetratricopeptide (TPR) repeat protein